MIGTTSIDHGVPIGLWLCLSQCHLVKEWLLEKISSTKKTKCQPVPVYPELPTTTHVIHLPSLFPAHFPTTHLVTVTTCISYFAWCCDEIPEQGSLRKEGFLLAQKWDEVHQGRKGTVAGAWDNWSHCTYSQESESGKCPCLASFFSFSFILISPSLWNGTSHP